MMNLFNVAAFENFDGGRMRAAIEQELRLCQLDCKDRPSLDGERTVTIKLHMKPVQDDTGDLDSVDVGFSIAHSLPKRSSRTYNMKAARGGLLFNDLSPDNVNQMTIPGMGPQPNEERQHDADERQEERDAQ